MSVSPQSRCPLAFLLVMDDAVLTTVVFFLRHNPPPKEHSKGGEKAPAHPSRTSSFFCFICATLAPCQYSPGLTEGAWQTEIRWVSVFDCFFGAQERTPLFLRGHLKHTYSSQCQDWREAGHPEPLLWPLHPQAQQTPVNCFSQNQTRCAPSWEAAGSSRKKGQSPKINC